MFKEWKLSAFLLIAILFGCLTDPAYVSQCTCGDVRLVGGPSSTSGRVEVCVNNTWGTVCDDNWDNNDAKVVCRMLNYSTSDANATHNAYFGQGSGPILLDNVQCDSNETSILSCSHNGIGLHSCDHSEDAGVVCEASTIFSEHSDVTTILLSFYGGVLAVYAIVTSICCIMLCITKYHHGQSYNVTSNTQQFELGSARTIQTTTRSYPLKHQPPPSHQQQPSVSNMQQPPASFTEQQSNPYPQYLYLPPGDNNTGYPDQETDLEAETLQVPPPPSYDNNTGYHNQKTDSKAKTLRVPPPPSYDEVFKT